MSEKAGVREVTDARVLAMLAHPLRRRLLDVLRVHGPATASVLAERTGQRVGNISHHVKALADVGLVGEAPELAKDRRERWWRLVDRSLRWSGEALADDPAAEAVAQAVHSLTLDRHAGYVRAWFAADDEEREPWRGSSFSMQRWLHLTPDELREVAAEVSALIERWGERELPDDGARREPVLVFAYGVPAQP
ncbi:winged helix-turn-helix domain-containing protein [Blastococcus sp. CCUG 61487]|uniref:ArsR/SmtB family transcription factor n=1 Tax=Blastococcus sp. CCUG 61487 TaxID=1840703 RepID=UPI0010C0AFDE|nr:winged helix-turn-helix domain-containing protein [Blastococcus sp. CCUG 61487]TKJ19842.1 transcriptional regulator [Blastococcus sp. CCUG 61487]